MSSLTPVTLLTFFAAEGEGNYPSLSILVTQEVDCHKFFKSNSSINQIIYYSLALLCWVWSLGIPITLFHLPSSWEDKNFWRICILFDDWNLVVVKTTPYFASKWLHTSMYYLLVSGIPDLTFTSSNQRFTCSRKGSYRWKRSTCNKTIQSLDMKFPHKDNLKDQVFLCCSSNTNLRWEWNVLFNTKIL